jgi:hypothetical protein
MLKIHGTPQKTASRISDEGTVKRKESKSIPPRPKPTPVKTYPMNALRVKLALLSSSSLEKRGFLLNGGMCTSRIGR